MKAFTEHLPCWDSLIRYFIYIMWFNLQKFMKLALFLHFKDKNLRIRHVNHLALRCHNEWWKTGSKPMSVWLIDRLSFHFNILYWSYFMCWDLMIECGEVISLYSLLFILLCLNDCFIISVNTIKLFKPETLIKIQNIFLVCGQIEYRYNVNEF